MLPYANGRILNSEIRNSGSATRCSTNTKMTSRTTPPISPASTSGLVQPIALVP